MIFQSFADMKEWLDLFGLQMNKITGSHYTSGSHHSPLNTPQLSPQFSINVGLVNQQKESEDNLKSPNLLLTNDHGRRPSLTPDHMDPVLNAKLSTRSSSFGQGLLLSDINGRAVVTIVDGSQGDVVQSVLASVLNASSILEASHGGREEYYFLKSTSGGFNSDYNELQRLSGTYNISTETGIRKNGDSKVLCAQNRASTICILYEIEKRMANRWALKKALREAISAAWRKEVNAVKNGLSGFNHEWTNNERAELTSMGEVRGYQGVEVNSIHKYPQLIGQSSNIRFVPEAEARKKRKNWQ